MRKQLFAVMLLVFIAVPAQADFNNAVVFYSQGEYDQAFREMQSLAVTAKHPLAMYFLGIMYSNGQGVEQDLKEGAKWYKAAAKLGVAPAQYRLGKLYMKGKGVPKDMETAYAWFSVAVVNGHKLSVPAKAQAEQELSPEELDQAEKLADKFKQKYRKPEKKPGQP